VEGSVGLRDRPKLAKAGSLVQHPHKKNRGRFGRLLLIVGNLCDLLMLVGGRTSGSCSHEER